MEKHIKALISENPKMNSLIQVFDLKLTNAEKSKSKISEVRLPEEEELMKLALSVLPKKDGCRSSHLIARIMNKTNNNWSIAEQTFYQMLYFEVLEERENLFYLSGTAPF